MGQDLNAIPLLARREIEARLAAPLLEAFAPLCGREEALARLERVIVAQARQAGAEMAARLGDDSLTGVERVAEMWWQGGALEIEVLARAGQRLDFNVRRCAYAQMYRELGLEELGLRMSCGRDFAFFQGFNPRIQLTRARSILAGADFCDFRFRLEPSAGL